MRSVATEGGAGAPSAAGEVGDSGKQDSLDPAKRVVRSAGRAVIERRPAVLLAQFCDGRVHLM